MGVITHVTGIHANSPAKKVADFCHDVDPKNANQIDNLISQESIDGVLLGVSDPLLPYYFEICDRNKLPCYSNRKSTLAFSSKQTFIDVCDKYQIETIPRIANVKESTLQLDESFFPLVVKPVDGGASAGVSLCKNSKELNGAIQAALEVSIKKEAILEKAMFVDDLFAYYTFIDGGIFLSAVGDRIKSSKQGNLKKICLFAEYPSKHIKVFMQKMHPKLMHMFKDLRIMNGVLSIQFFYDGESFFAYDPGFRIQGEAQHKYLKEIYGLDQREMLIEFALGQKSNTRVFENENNPELNGKLGRTIWVLGSPGKVSAISGIEAIRLDYRVISIQSRFSLGEKIEDSMIGTERQVLMRIHLLAESRSSLDQINRTVVEKLSISDENGNSLIQDIYLSDD